MAPPFVVAIMFENVFDPRMVSWVKVSKDTSHVSEKQARRSVIIVFVATQPGVLDPATRVPKERRRWRSEDRSESIDALAVDVGRSGHGGLTTMAAGDDGVVVVGCWVTTMGSRVVVGATTTTFGDGGLPPRLAS